MSRLTEALKSARQKLNIERRIAYLGDGSGEVHDRDIPGQYLVRFPTGSDTLGAPVSLPAEVNANFPATDGLTVEIGLRNDRPVILGAYYEGLVAAAINPLQLNPIDEPANKFVNQDQITTFYATRHADTVNNPFYAVVFPGFFRVGSTLTYFAGSQIDLSSFLPASPNHCYAVVLIKTDGTLEAFASTAIDVSDPLAMSDIQEALNSATAGSIPVRAWELANDDTLLTVDPDRQVDIREIVGGRTLTASDVPAHAHSIHTGLTTGDDHTQYLLRQPSANWTIDASALYMGAIGGAAIAAQKLTIYTGTDANKGLQIRQNSATQSANLQEWSTSTGTILSFVDSIGRFGIGVTSFNFNSALELSRTWTDTSGTQVAYRAIGRPAPSGASTSNYYGFLGGITISSSDTNGTSGLLIGLFPSVDVDGSGTIANTRLIQAQTIVRGSKLVTTGRGIYSLLSLVNTGSVQTFDHIYIAPISNTGTGTVTNYRGIYIENIAAGTSTNFAILTNSGNIVFNEGGDGNTIIRGEGDNDQYLFCTVPATDRFGIGTNAAITKFHTVLNNATTATVDNVVTIEHSSTGTPAAGFGAGLLFALESSTTTQQTAARITVAHVVATHASRTERMTLLVSDAGGEREGIRIEASGTAPMLGFFGVNAVVRPTALTTALTTITHTAPGTPDYAIQDFTQTSPWGFASQDEANTVLSVIRNLQIRNGEIETKIQALGLFT